MDDIKALKEFKDKQAKMAEERLKANQSVLRNYNMLDPKKVAAEITAKNRLAVDKKSGKIVSASDLDKKEAVVISIFTKKKVESKE